MREFAEKVLLKVLWILGCWWLGVQIARAILS
jgi:hypothetical protein